MKPFTITAISLLMLTEKASAQNPSTDPEMKPIMEVTPDVKTLHPDRMGLAPGTTLAEVLQHLPELTMLGSSALTSDYSLIVDGDAYNLDAEVYLAQTRLSEVQQIDLITNGITAGVPGVMGYILVTTRDIPEGRHGGADLGVSSRGDVSPSVELSWKEGRWSSQASLSADWCRSHMQSGCLEAPSQRWSETDIWQRPMDEQAQGRLTYQGKHDCLDLRLTQLCQHCDNESDQLNRDAALGQRLSRKVNDHRATRHDYTALLRWDHHLADHHSLTLKGQYEYASIPDADWRQFAYGTDDTCLDTLQCGDIERHATSHTLSTTLLYEGRLAPSLLLEAGATYNYCSNSEHQLSACGMLNPLRQRIEPQEMEVTLDTRTHTSQAFAQLTWEPSEHWHLMVGERGRYVSHHFRSDGVSDDQATQHFDSWQSSAMASYRPSASHTLLAGYNRRMLMPSATQLYPVPLLQDDASRISYLKGNDKLRSPTYDIWNVGYSYGRSPWEVTLEGRYFTAATSSAPGR